MSNFFDKIDLVDPVVKVSYNIDDNTMCPIITFFIGDRSYDYKLTIESIQNYNAGLDVDKIDEMFSNILSISRDYKLSMLI